MKYLFICGSQSPTYCGIGKFTKKLIGIIQGQNTKVQIFYITNVSQSEHNKNDTTLDNVTTFKSNLLNNGLLDIFNRIKEIKPFIVNIQYQTFRKNYLDSLFPLIIKLANPKTKVISTIHEFNGFTIKGKLRQVLPIIFSDKILFSDKQQLETANRFTRGLFKYKMEIFFTGPSVSSHLENFAIPNFANPILNIGFHGYIQSAKGLDFLLKALLKFDLKLFKLHILGAFKPMIDYADKESVINYQKELLNIIDTNQQLKDNIIIWGDIEPGSEKFKAILKDIELLVFPFTDYITIRRSSFANSFLNSNSLVASTYNDKYSDDFLNCIIPIEPNEQSILNFLQMYSNYTTEKKITISQEQIELKKYFLSKQLETDLYNQVTLNSYA